MEASVQDFAKMLGVSRQTVYNYMENKIIRSKKIGKMRIVVYTEKDLDKDRYPKRGRPFNS